MKKIITINDYGKVNITLKKIMDEQGITRNALARSINARFEVVDKWYNGYIEKIDTDVLARICCVLSCKPGDLIQYNAVEDISTNNNS